MSHGTTLLKAYNDDGQIHSGHLMKKIDVSRSHLSNGPSPSTIYDSQTIGTAAYNNESSYLYRQNLRGV
jgi:hypothetical protein